MLTSKGFYRKTYEDLLLEMQERARVLFGADVDLSERTPLGKWLQLEAYTRAEDYEQMEKLYYAPHVAFAEDNNLDYAVKKRSMSRKKWLKADGLVQLELMGNTTIQAGTIVGKATGIKYSTVSEVISTTQGIYDVFVICTEAGEVGNAEINEINTIYTPVVGLRSVSNSIPFRNGQDRETDEQLRERYFDSSAKEGTNRIDSMRAKILDEVEGVRSCLIFENESNVQDVDGRPPHSFEVVVLGGEPQNIAEKIFANKPAGIRAYGNQELTVLDKMDNPYQIGFSYAGTIPIYAKVKVKTNTNYPLNGDEVVKEELIKYIGGEYNNEIFNGLGMAENVVHSKVSAVVALKVPGVVDVELALSTDGQTYSEENILVGRTQVAEIDVTRIEVSKLV